MYSLCLLTEKIGEFLRIPSLSQYLLVLLKSVYNTKGPMVKDAVNCHSIFLVNNELSNQGCQGNGAILIN